MVASSTTAKVERSCNAGLLCVAASALLFGSDACLVKLIPFDLFLMMQIRWVLQASFNTIALLAAFKRQEGSPSVFAEGSCDLSAEMLYWMGAANGGNAFCKCLYILLWCVLGGAFSLIWWTALRTLTLGDATCLVYTSPMFGIVFAYLLLRERPRSLFWFLMTLAFGTAGTVCVQKPSFIFGQNGDSGVHPVNAAGVAVALAAAAVAGIQPAFLKLTGKLHWSVLQFYKTFLWCFLLNPTVMCIAYLNGLRQHPLLSSMPRPVWESTGLLIAATCLSFLGFSFQTRGQQLAPVGQSLIMGYIEIPFNLLLQVLVFSTKCDWLQGLGAALIVLSGILNICLVKITQPMPPVNR